MLITKPNTKDIKAAVAALDAIVNKAYKRDGKHEDYHVHPDLITAGRVALAAVRGVTPTIGIAEVASELQNLVDIICGPRNVTLEDCDQAKWIIGRVTGHPYEYQG